MHFFLFSFFAPHFLCFRNPALCTSCSICPGQTEGSLAIPTTCSPWWRKPGASRDLAPAPSVSTAGLGKWALWGSGEIEGMVAERGQGG